MSDSAAYGKIEEFPPYGNTPWSVYIEKAEFYFSANSITDDVKKKNILLSVIGNETYSILRDLVVPKQLKDVTLDEILEKAKGHFQPPPSAIVERFKFQKRERRAGESTSDFVRELRKLSEHCQFGTTLDERIRDQIVFGINKDVIQQKLLDTKDLTLKIAIDICTSFESTSEGVKSLAHKTSDAAVNKISSCKPSGKWETKPGAKKMPQMPQHRPCYRCHQLHLPATCPFINAECHRCHHTGHIQKACKSKKIFNKKSTGKQDSFKKNTNNNFRVKTVTEPENEFFLNYVEDDKKDIKWTKTVTINGKQLGMEIDSGAAHSIVSKNTADILFEGKLPIVTTNIKLQTYTKQTLTVIGKLVIDVEVDNEIISDLHLLVIKENGPSLIGKSWLNASKLFWPYINKINCISKNDLIRKYPEVFEEGIGTFKGPPVKIILKPDTKPVFLKARPVPFAMRKAVDEELDRLTDQGILEPVSYSEWASPIVVVAKKNGQVRLCGDYRATVNASTETDNYPLPRMEELFANLAGGQTFTVFDLKDAYLQQPVDEETSQLLTINTHRGLFKVKRLVFGVKSAPGIFQRKMENMLKKIDKTGVLLDDVITTGIDSTEHVGRIEKILKCFSEYGIRINKDKFKFMLPEVKYLGHKITKEGLSPLPEKVEAILNAPSPTNVTQLRSFLGILTYYRAFLNDIASVLEPLHRLLDNNRKWEWSDVHEKAFVKAKKMLSVSPVLELYDVNKQIILSCDASDYGVGCVLSHLVNNIEKPVAYASRTMNKCERNYAQIDKEALSIMFGVTRFHQYLSGKSFKIVTDHKPLLRLFSPTKRVPDTLSPKMLRWSLVLSGYNYTIEYREGKNNQNADALSRLPLEDTSHTVPDPPEVMFVSGNEDFPITAETIAEWTTDDSVLKQVLTWTKEGWPKKNVSTIFEPYFRRKEAITSLQNCLLWGHRVIIPEKGRKQMLKILHCVHQGMCLMKSKARSVMWWPNLDKDIENTVHNCELCQMYAKQNPKGTTLKWTSTKNPWDRVHIDHAGPFEGKYFFILVDSFSKWVEVYEVPNTGTRSTIKVLRKIFATFGLPIEIVSDNASSFTSYEFQNFVKKNGIVHTLIPPFNPSSNGQAERFVQTVKQCLKKLDKTDLNLSIQRYLLESHATPHSTTHKTPAELMFNRQIRTTLQLVVPKEIKNSNPIHNYKQNDLIYLRNYGRGNKWLRGTITKLSGSNWVFVCRDDGLMCKRHVNQIRRDHRETLDSGKDKNENIEFNQGRKELNVRGSETQTSTDKQISDDDINLDPVCIAGTDANVRRSNIVVDPNLSGTSVTSDSNGGSATKELRRSSRIRKPVVRLNYGERGVIS